MRPGPTWEEEKKGEKGTPEKGVSRFATSATVLAARFITRFPTPSCSERVTMK